MPVKNDEFEALLMMAENLRKKLQKLFLHFYRQKLQNRAINEATIFQAHECKMSHIDGAEIL